MKTTYLWFLPAVIIYIWVWFLAIKNIKKYGTGKDGGTWVILNVLMIVTITLSIGLSKLN